MTGKQRKVELYFATTILCILIPLLMYTCMRASHPYLICTEYSKPYIGKCPQSPVGEYDCVKKDCKLWTKNPNYLDWLLRKK